MNTPRQKRSPLNIILVVTAVIGLIVATYFIATNNKDGSDNNVTQDEDNTDTRLPFCSDNKKIEFDSASVCLDKEKANDFKKVDGQQEYISQGYLVNNDLIVSKTSKSELENLYSFTPAEDDRAATFSYQKLGSETIAGYDFTVYAHGYYPLEAEVPEEFDESSASISGYSYAYELKDGDWLLFDSASDYDAKEWIEDMVIDINQE
jgi:hypothetical protein